MFWPTMIQLSDPRLMALLSLVFIISGLLTLLNKNRHHRQQQRFQQQTLFDISTFPPKNTTTLPNTAEPKATAILLQEVVEDPGQEEQEEEPEPTQQQTQTLLIPTVSWRASISFPPRTRTSLSSSVIVSRKGSSCARWSVSEDSASDGGSSLPGSLPGSVPKENFFMGIGGQFGRTPSL